MSVPNSDINSRSTEFLVLCPSCRWAFINTQDGVCWHCGHEVFWKVGLSLRYRRLKAQLYEWSNDLVLAFLDEDWDAVLAVIRQLSHNSGFLKLIEPSWGNLAEFFEGVGK